VRQCSREEEREAACQCRAVRWCRGGEKRGETGRAGRGEQREQVRGGLRGEKTPFLPSLPHSQAGIYILERRLE